MRGAHSVETLRPIEDSLGAALSDIVDDGQDRRGRLLDVDSSPREDCARVGVGAAEVDALDHGADSRSSLRGCLTAESFRCFPWEPCSYPAWYSHCTSSSLATDGSWPIWRGCPTMIEPSG